jgi:hypothetical protein
MSQRPTTARFVAACLCLIAAVSCGDVSSGSGASNGPSTTALSSPATASTHATVTTAAAPEGELPTALVGTWSGGGGKTLAFTAAGRYTSSSTALGEGRALVSGGRITLTPDGQEPVVTTWSVSGGKLYLQTLTIRPQGQPASSFGLTYDGTYLTFINPDGTSAGEYLRAG